MANETCRTKCTVTSHVETTFSDVTLEVTTYGVRLWSNIMELHAILVLVSGCREIIIACSGGSVSYLPNEGYLV